MQTDLNKITNFLEISESLGTAGQPDENQFTWIKEAGYQVVINLALTDSPQALPDEEKAVKSLGLMYVHIPVIWESPTAKDLQQFFDSMLQFQDKKIFVHCVLNMRVSVFIYLYRILIVKESQEFAYQDLMEIWEPDDVWQQFIDNHLVL